MSQIVSVSDTLFAKLEATARQRGLQGVEQLLEAWQANEDKRWHRSRAVQRIDDLRARLFATYGEMADSATLIREDRDR